MLFLLIIARWLNSKLTAFLDGKGNLAANTDLNNVTETGVYNLLGNTSYSNKPLTGAGILVVSNGSSSRFMQTLYRSDGQFAYRWYNGSWLSWYKFTGTEITT